MRVGVAIGAAALLAAAAMTQPASAQPADAARALEAALQNFPALILNANVVAAAPGAFVPPACPAAGARVEQKGGPTMAFLGTSPRDPELCRVRIGDEEMEAWFGIWGAGWAGGDQARQALQRIRVARTGDVVGFDTIAAPGAKWHDLVRHDGVEDIRLLGHVYKAVKYAHYREGFDGNSYRSLSTLWVDVATGLPIYATYQHISGAPELDGPLIPTAIVPAR